MDVPFHFQIIRVCGTVFNQIMLVIFQKWMIPQNETIKYFNFLKKITIYLLVFCLNHMKNLTLLLEFSTSNIFSSHALFLDVFYEGNEFLILLLCSMFVF